MIRPRMTRQTVWAWLAIAVVLFVSGWLRLSGLNWDEGHHLHPDERFLMMVTSSLETPSSPREYFDTASSPLNPRNKGFATFVYGTLPTTMLHFVGELTGRSGYGPLLLVGRALSAIADLATVALCILLGMWLVGRLSGGLLAGALYGFAVLPIQQAHFFTVDSIATFFTTLSLVILVSAQRHPRLWKWALAGACWGAALACKLSVYTFVVMPVILGVWQAWEVGRGIRRDGETRKEALERASFRILLFGLVAFAVVRVAMPDAFRGPGLANILPEDRWLANVEEARRLVSGEIDFPPGHQWTARTRFWFPWTNMVLWGLGPLLGIAAWGAVGLASWRLMRTRDASLLLPVGWTLVLFLHQGGQWVMSMRYLLPLYPAIIVVCAWALLRRWPPNWPRWCHGMMRALPAIVVMATAIWALAFTSIYRSSHTRVEASRWILSNLPEGSAIGNEVWDDALPLRVDGRDPFGGEYRGIDMHWYAEDEPDKLEAALGWLDEADVIVLSSNRLYDSIPRLWMRYPMTTRYYDALFSGELGFEKIAEFTSYPRLGFLTFPDQAAEEAFSVYDHPRVLIFRKTIDFNVSSAKEILAEALHRDVMRLTPIQEARAPGGLRLTDAEWERRNEGTIRLPQGSDEGSALAFLRFLLLMLLLGPIAVPIIFVLAENLPDRGWSLARPLGLAMIAWLTWLQSSLGIMPFSRISILICISIVSAVSAVLFLRNVGQWRAFLSQRWRLVLTSELIFCGTLVGMAFIRWMNPDLWHPWLSGEKPMNMAYLNAVLLSSEFPPHSPWHAGSIMNYYYFGYVMAALPIRVGGFAPEIGYNLLVAGFFGIFAAAVFGVGAAMAGSFHQGSRTIVGGSLAVLFTALAGNLAQWRPIWTYITEGAVRPEAWFWDATRVISHPPTEAGPITEFPFFTFLFADLHPHLFSLPLFATLIGIAIAVSMSERFPVGLFAIAAFLLGAIWTTNAWDLPTGALILIIALALRRMQYGSKTNPSTLLASISLPLLACVIFLPFHLRFGEGYGAFEFWKGSHTPLADYLLIHGAFLLVAIPGLILAHRRCEKMSSARFVYIAAGVCACILTAIGFLLPAVLLMLLTVAGVAFAARSGEIEWRWPLFMFGLAMAIGVFVEIFVLRGDIARMNTVFKFYLQTWVLLGLTCAAFAILVDMSLQRPWRFVWRGCLSIIGLIVLIYPITATPARIKNRMVTDAPRTLNGLAFLENAHLEVDGNRIALEDDLAGIRWLRENAVGLPILAEGTTHPQLYGWGARFSVHTGLPTIIGWDWHQRQQYAALPVDVISGRVDDVKTIYTTPDPIEAWQILRRYNAEFVIVGGLERALFPEDGIAKFEVGEGIHWNKVFEKDALIIYQVLPAD